jgi:hypothetical protein
MKFISVKWLKCCRVPVKLKNMGSGNALRNCLLSVVIHVLYIYIQVSRINFISTVHFVICFKILNFLLII